MPPENNLTTSEEKIVNRYNRRELVEVFPEAIERADQLAHVILLIFVVSYIDSKVLSDIRYVTDRIMLVHDESQYKAVLRDAFQILKHDTGLSSRERFVSLESRSWKEEPLLQAADLVAYENFKVIERRQAGHEMRKPMARILASSKVGGRNAFLLRAGLKEYRERIGGEALRGIFAAARIRSAT